MDPIKPRGGCWPNEERATLPGEGGLPFNGVRLVRFDGNDRRVGGRGRFPLATRSRGNTPSRETVIIEHRHSGGESRVSISLTRSPWLLVLSAKVVPKRKSFWSIFDLCRQTLMIFRVRAIIPTGQVEDRFSGQAMWGVFYKKDCKNCLGASSGIGKGTILNAVQPVSFVSG